MLEGRSGSSDSRSLGGTSGLAPNRPVFEAVGERCAFVAPSTLEESGASALAERLARSGMKVARVDPVSELRTLIDRPRRPARHLRFATSERAAQWAYGRKGIRIPGTAIEQVHLGERVAIDQAERGDLIFARYGDAIRLLGLFTGEESVLGIPRGGRMLVTEIPVNPRNVSAHMIARRPIARQLHVLTVFSGSSYEIFDSRDIDRIVCIDR
jgi:hypothetical protein